MRTGFWLLVIPVAILLDWVNSVAFIAACSIYANAAGDFAAARADINPRLEHIESRLDLIMEMLSLPSPSSTESSLAATHEDDEEVKT